MSCKTDLPYEIVYDSQTSLKSLGAASGASWSLQPRFAGSKLTSLVIKQNNGYGKFKIDVTVKFISRYYSQPSQYDRNVTKYIENGQNTIEIETQLPAFKYGDDKVNGIITVSKCTVENNVTTQLSSDIFRLLNNQESFSDAILMCGKTKISVHKCILSIRSPVFAAMFKNEMQEGISGIVKIEDMEEKALFAMLKYIYSGKTDNLTDVMASDLLCAADKYQLKELKTICVEKLKSSMTENNIFRILLLGDVYDSGLKDVAKNFVCKCRFPQLENTDGWNSLKEEHPDLAIEVLTSVVKYLQTVVKYLQR